MVDYWGLWWVPGGSWEIKMVMQPALSAVLSRPINTNKESTLRGVVSLQVGNDFDSIVYNEQDTGWGFGSGNASRTEWSGVKEDESEWVFVSAVLGALFFLVRHLVRAVLRSVA